MNKDFTTIYQEILLENLIAIIKQNFFFQTQIKLYENNSKQKEEIEKKYNDLLVLSEKNNLIAEEYEKNKFLIEQSKVFSDEKNRIQNALNQEMQRSLSLTAENKKLNEYIKELEKKVSSKINTPY